MLQVPTRLQSTAVLALAVGSVLGKWTVPAAGMAVTDARQPLVLEYSLANGMTEAQMVAKVSPSCRCLSVDLQPGRVLEAGEEIVFEVTYWAPWSGGGRVRECVAVTMVPSGQTIEFPVEVETHRRLGFDPTEVAFGTVRLGEMPPEHTVVLAGTMADSVMLGVPVPADRSHVFGVQLGENRQSLHIRFPEEPPVSGILSETWRIPTDDAELPELPLTVTATVEGALAAVPTSLVLSSEDRGGRREIRLRRWDDGGFTVQSVTIRPAAHGATATAQRIAGGGWKVMLAGLDASALRQAETPVWIEIETDVPGCARLRVPVRVDETEGEER